MGSLITDDLAKQGASLLVAGPDQERQQLSSRRAARTTGPEELLTSQAGILVPAALGGILTPQIVPALRCRAIAGPASRQLSDDSVADLLHARDITWAPDPVVSSGGIVGSAAREINRLTEPEAEKRLTAIGDRLGIILDESARSGLPPLEVALRHVRARLGRRHYAVPVVALSGPQPRHRTRQ